MSDDEIEIEVEIKKDVYLKIEHLARKNNISSEKQAELIISEVFGKENL